MNNDISFSVIVVCFNPGAALKGTVDSVLSQSYGRYEIIIKDKGSDDGSVDAYVNHPDTRIKYIRHDDSGIYDAMNQAVTYASGDFVIFLNAGDAFHDDKVLEKTASKDLKKGTIVYGDTYFSLYDSLSVAPPKITKSVCYRNIPCHQAIFYAKELLLERKFDTRFKIRADYEHFLNAFIERGIDCIYLGFPVCSYEGGGFSEKRSNRALDKKEYDEIVRKYFTASERFRYRAGLILSLHKLRGALARNKVTAGMYQGLKRLILKGMR